MKTLCTPKHTGSLKNLNVHSAVHHFSQGVLSGSTGLEVMKEQGSSALTAKTNLLRKTIDMSLLYSRQVLIM